MFGNKYPGHVTMVEDKWRRSRAGIKRVWEIRAEDKEKIKMTKKDKWEYNDKICTGIPTQSIDDIIDIRTSSFSCID